MTQDTRVRPYLTSGQAHPTVFGSVGRRTGLCQAGRMATSRKLLCIAYAAIAVIALLATWRNGGPYSHSPAGVFIDFWRDTKANNATRFITADILMFGLAASIWMVTEARRRGIRFVWAYIVGSFLVAISVAFPLFLIARELRVDRTEPVAMRPLDTVLLAAFSAAIVAMTIWVDI